MTLADWIAAEQEKAGSEFDYEENQTMAVEMLADLAEMAEANIAAEWVITILEMLQERYQ
jgi:hypothetical protein